MSAPQALLDLVNSLQLVGVPISAVAGDRISPRVTPDLTAPAAGANPLLAALVRSDPLAQIDVDLGPIVNYVAQTLGIDVATVLKAVEFNRPAETQAGQVDVASATVRDLPHLVPLGPNNVLNLSQLVEGLIGRSSGKLTFTGRDLPSQVTALITKPAVLASLPKVELSFRLLDEAGAPLVSGTHFLGSTAPVPDFVLLPVVFEPGTNAPAVVRRSVACDVTVTYTPIGGAQEILQRTLGPLPIDLSTTLVPVMAVLTEHAVGDSSFPGRVFVGVPANSPLPDAAAAFGALGQVSGVLTALNAGLGLLDIPIPGSITAARSALTTVVGLPVGRFRKGDLIGFFEWVLGIPPWDDWQGIFSAMFMFGPSSRRAFVGAPTPFFSGFDLFPSALGVGAVPDFTTQPPAASVGTATQLFPPLPGVPPGGSFNDLITSINFPFP